MGIYGNFMETHIIWGKSGRGMDIVWEMNWNKWGNDGPWANIGTLEKRWVSMGNSLREDYGKNTWEANDPQAVPSGKRLHNYGKSPFFYGKIHYFYGHFPYIFVCLPGRVPSGPKRWETPSQQDTLEITGMRASPIHIHFGLEDSPGASLFQLFGLRARSS